MPEQWWLDPQAVPTPPDWLWLTSNIRTVDFAIEVICNACEIPSADSAAVRALGILKDALPATKRQPDDLEARVACHEAARLVHSSIGPAQLGASFGIGECLGNITGINRGHASCAIVGPVLRCNQAQDADRQGLVASAFGRNDGDAATAVTELIDALNLPRHLNGLDVRREQLEDVVQAALQNPSVKASLDPIDPAEKLWMILEMAW